MTEVPEHAYALLEKVRDELDFLDNRVYGFMLFLEAYVDDRDFEETVEEFIDETVELGVKNER